MVPDVKSPDEISRYAEPDKIQQSLNRLQKQYEHLVYEDRRLRIADEIENMELSEEDRRELLRRLG